MKKIIMVVSLAIATIGFSFAQTENQDRQYQEGQTSPQTFIDGEFDSDQKSDIDLEQLPATIHQDLNVGDFSNWEVEEAYRIEDAVRSETGVAYEVLIARRGEKKVLHYDERGNFIPTREDKKRKRD
jgi:hypothetical protein